MDKKTMLKHLRPLDRIERPVLYEARLQAADELERLYAMEERFESYLKELKSIRDNI